MIALAASVAVLSGCASAPHLPPGPTPAQVKATVAEYNEAWWRSIAPDEPMPVVDPVEYLAPDDDGHQITDCIVKAQLPGIMSEEYTYFGITTPAAVRGYEKVQFVCSMMYPPDLSHPEELGILSPEQLDYLYEYFTTRLAPCMELLGYQVTGTPTHDEFVNRDFLAWAPYYAMTPQPHSTIEWRRFDLRCPPPPIPLPRPATP
jgi:hypothetical protein